MPRMSFTTTAISQQDECAKRQGKKFMNVMFPFTPFHSCHATPHGGLVENYCYEVLRPCKGKAPRPHVVFYPPIKDQKRAPMLFSVASV